MDFFALLPPELVLAISLYLDIDTISSCLLVSQQWYSLLSGLEPYWRQACIRLGLSKHLIEDLCARYKSTKCLLFAVYGHRRIVADSRQLNCTLTEGYPYNVHYVCNSAKGNTLVGTIYKDFRPCGIVIKTIKRTSISKTVIDPKFAKLAQNRTYWASVVSDTLVHVTASGLWSMYDLTRNGALLTQWRGSAIFDSEVKIAVCEHCYSICTSKLISTHAHPAYWDLRVMSPSTNHEANVSHTKPSVVKFKVEADMQYIGVKQTTNCKKSVLLFSDSTQTNSRGMCARHSLLLQCGSGVYTYTMCDDKDSSTNKLMLSYSPESSFSPGSDTQTLSCRNTGLSTELVLSTDKELLGMVFQSQLIVWERRTSQLLTVADIELITYTHEQIRLVALGRVYSLIGLEFSSSLLVVLTNTGHVVRELTDFADRHSRIVPPYIEFLVALQDSWLSDLSIPPSSSLPAVVYWNKTNRAIEGISFGRETEDGDSDAIVPTRGRPWWKWW